MPATRTKAPRKGGTPAPRPAAPSLTTDPASPVIFCDIGDILGQPVFSDPPPHLERLDVFPFVRPVLAELRDSGHRLGVISNTGSETKERIDQVLHAADLFELFDPALLIYSSEVGLTKDSPEIFRLAAKQAGLEGTPEACLFVGENARERSFAAQAGFRVARDLTLLEPVLRAVAPAVDLGNLDACINDARLAGLDADPGPDDPTEFASLIQRLAASQSRLPPLYRETVFEPYVAKLQSLGQAGFAEVLLSDPARERLAGLTLDIAHALLQNGERFNDIQTDAFEEVVSDLYDGFLSAQDRKGIPLPEHLVVAPLVKWGQPEFGPYTWPVQSVRAAFNVGATIVSLPPANARAGLMAWAALGHETAGHDILHANAGLAAELGGFVHDELKAANIGFGLPDYWSARIDETASDVMGILNMGPAAAVGLIAYFRGLSAAAGRPARLRSAGPASDPHPADILRGYLGAATVSLLSFNAASKWASVLDAETDNDLQPIRLAGLLVSPEIARQSARIVAGAIATRKCTKLGGHALIEIQDWRDRDELLVADLREVLTTTRPLARELAEGTFAAHVVAAAVTGGLSTGGNLQVLFTRMVGLLKEMHDRNPSWGPLFIAHPSSVVRHLAAMPQAAGTTAFLGHARAVAIVCGCARTSTGNLPRTLAQLAVEPIGFQQCVHTSVLASGFQIGLDQVPNGPDVHLIQVVNVIQNASRI